MPHFPSNSRLFPRLAWLLCCAASLCAADKSGVSPTKISLPSGPGSVDGLGESFEPQLNTGTFTYSVPLELPKVRGAASPSLALAYNSGSSNGPCGLGWKLEVPRLQRQTDKGLPQYLASDTIIDWTGEELVKLADGAFRCENETKPIRFEPQPNGSWLARLPNGSVMALGATANARLAGASGTFLWMVSSLTDTNGNRSSFTYLHDHGQIYLQSVTIGAHANLPSGTFTVDFSYESGRPDPILDYRPGFASQTLLRLTGITLTHGTRRVGHYQLAYEPAAAVSLLKSITRFGDDRSSLGTDATVNKDFLPPLQFAYSPTAFPQNSAVVSVVNAPGYSLAQGRMELADANGDGLPDLVIDDGQKYYTALNRGAGKSWGDVQAITNSPSARLTDAGTHFADLTGDGKICLIAQDDPSFAFRPFESATRFGTSASFLISSGFVFSNPNLRFVDLNNDKAMDLMLATGDGHFEFLINGQASGLPNYRLPNPPAAPDTIAFTDGWQLADLNGDRLVDLLKPATQVQGGCVVCYAQGWGKFGARQTIAGGPQESELGSRGLGGLTFIDINQDGWADCVYVDSGVVKMWLNVGGIRFGAPVSIMRSDIPAYEEGNTGIRFADINGNGSLDIIWNRTDLNSGARLQYLDLFPDTKPYLLISATNELGGSVAIEYRASVAFMTAADGTPQQWTSAAPFPMPVVSALVEGDGRGNSYRSEFSYRNAYFDGREKEFRGFEFATRRDFGDPAQGAPSLAATMQFHVGTRSEGVSLKGRLRLIEVRDDASGAVFSRVSHRWKPRQLALGLDPAESRRVTLAFEDLEETTLLERGANAQAVTLHREFDVDDYGNQTRVADYGRVEGDNRSAWDDERITVTTYSAGYASGLNAWLLDRPIQTEVRDENGTTVARTRRYYDDPDFNGNNLGVISKGNLTLERRWTDIAKDAFIAASRTVYDGYGNVQKTFDPLGKPADFAFGHYRSFGYDDTFHTYPETETVGTGNSALSTLTASATYDLGLGVLKAFKDFNSQTTSLVVDTFGRVTDIVRPGDTAASPTVSYSYLLSQGAAGSVLNHIETRRRETAGGGTFDSRDYFDGLGRKIQSRTESEIEGKSVVAFAAEYNQRKGLWKSYLPYFSTGGLEFAAIPTDTAFRESGYDATGRTVRSYQPPLQPNGSRAFSETSYEPLAVLLKDEEQTDSTSARFGAANRQIFDGLKSSDGKSRLREVQEIVKLTDTGDATSAPATWSTRYTFDLLDNLVKIVDSQNNTKTLSFDALSRLTGMDDPDAGLLALVYDDASNLKQSTDANGHIIYYQYDGVNRPISEDYLDAAGRSPDVTFVYDIPITNLDLGDGSKDTAANTKGRLAFVRDISGEEHLSYDDRGRTAWEVKRLPDSALGLLVSYRTQFAFDSADRISRLTYPDGDYIDYRYNARTLLQKITGGSKGFVLSDVTYRASGQEDTLSYGNGVTTVRDYDTRLRLSSLKTNAPGNVRSYLDYGYEFDAASNITKIEDRRTLTGLPDAAARQNTQSFKYDDLYRILQVAWPSARAGLPGQIEWRYDRIGNMLSQNSNLTHNEQGKPVANLGNMVSGGTSGAWSRSGRGESPAGPHALTTVNPGGGGVTRSYAYDRKGNMTHIDGLACTYDFKDRMVTAENDQMRAEYIYDHTDRRVTKKVTPKSAPSTLNRHLSTTVHYINRYFEIRDYDSPVKYVWQGSTRLARATGTLASNIQPIQWVRLRPGWNLVSMTTSAESRAQLLSDSRIAAISHRDEQAGAWRNLATADSPPSAFVAWLEATVAAVVPVRGPLLTQPVTLTGQPQFLPIYAREALDVAGTFSATSEIWFRNSALSRWDIRPIASTASLVLPPTLPRAAPNTALYLAATAGGNLTLNLPPPSFSLRYYHGDHLGTTSVVTDAEGAITEETCSYPFGHPRNQYRPTSAAESYGFTQKEMDAESGLHYFETRLLVSTIGRFNRVDPLFSLAPASRANDPRSLGLYGYCWNRPSVWLDTTGCAPTSGDTNQNIDLGRLVITGSQSEKASTSNSSGNFDFAAMVPGVANFRQGGHAFRQGDYRSAALHYGMAYAEAALTVFSLGELTLARSAASTALRGAAENAATKQLTVIGHAPDYIKVAEAKGANYLKWSENWNFQKQGDFIKSVIQRGDDVLIGTSIRPGESVLRHEIKQLIKAGYEPVEQGSLLLRKTN